jgi:hypothetical protein
MFDCSLDSLRHIMAKPTAVLIAPGAIDAVSVWPATAAKHGKPCAADTRLTVKQFRGQANKRCHLWWLRRECR